MLRACFTVQGQHMHSSLFFLRTRLFFGFFRVDFLPLTRLSMTINICMNEASRLRSVQDSTMVTPWFLRLITQLYHLACGQERYKEFK